MFTEPKVDVFQSSKAAPFSPSTAYDANSDRITVGISSQLRK